MRSQKTLKKLTAALGLVLVQSLAGTVANTNDSAAIHTDRQTLTFASNFLGTGFGIQPVRLVWGEMQFFPKQNEWFYGNIDLMPGLKISENQSELTSKTGEFEVLDSVEGTFRYKPNAAGGVHQLDLIVDFSGMDLLYQLTFAMSGDPLFEHQWFLKNTAQNAFAANSGVVGEDINALPVIADGLTGKGIKVAVVDNGTDIHHEDLVNNMAAVGHYSVLDDDATDPTHRQNEVKQAHGTAVAGIIGATAWNGVGGRGVAPGVEMVAYKYVGYRKEFDDFQNVYGFTDLSKDVDVFNQSFGISYYFPIPTFYIEEMLALIDQSHHETRNGMGASYVTAAGNGFNYFSINDIYYLQAEENKGYPIETTIVDPLNNILQSIGIGAINASGKRSSYSTVGSALWVSAPGGEYGSEHPAMVTTDPTGCDRGSNQGLVKGEISGIMGNFEVDPNCNYTHKMNGTSSAAPVTSGVIALMLEANPRLSWRDVKSILAQTAEKIDADHPVLKKQVGDDIYQTHLGWMTNAAGYAFSPTYGFGRVDVEAAVKLAKSYVDFLPAQTNLMAWKKQEANLDIPEASITGASSQLLMNQDLTIEAVQVILNVEHSNINQLAVELISPAGTVSQLVLPYAAGPNPALSLAEISALEAYQQDPSLPKPDVKGGIRDNLMMTNAFFGESSQGTWTLKVIDLESENTAYRTVEFLSDGSQDRKRVELDNDSEGVFENWSIRILGH